MDKSIARRNRLRGVIHNLIAAGILFALFVVIDWVFLDTSSVTNELLLVGPVTWAAWIMVPIVFWIANRRVFADSRRPQIYRLVFTVVLSIAWCLVAILPFLLVHVAIGGRL